MEENLRLLRSAPLREGTEGLPGSHTKAEVEFESFRNRLFKSQKLAELVDPKGIRKRRGDIFMTDCFEVQMDVITL